MPREAKKHDTGAAAQAAVSVPDAETVARERARRRDLRAPLIALLARAVIDELHSDESGAGATGWREIAVLLAWAGSAGLILLAAIGYLSGLPDQPVSALLQELMR